jgi:hypothetical protein
MQIPKIHNMGMIIGDRAITITILNGAPYGLQCPYMITLNIDDTLYINNDRIVATYDDDIKIIDRVKFLRLLNTTINNKYGIYKRTLFVHVNHSGKILFQRGHAIRLDFDNGELKQTLLKYIACISTSRDITYMRENLLKVKQYYDCDITLSCN